MWRTSNPRPPAFTANRDLSLAGQLPFALREGQTTCRRHSSLRVEAGTFARPGIPSTESKVSVGATQREVALGPSVSFFDSGG